MHLWPSMRIRDSFKISYLKKLEWNLQRMNSEKHLQQQQRLLDHDNNVEDDGGRSNQQNGVVDGEHANTPILLKRKPPSSGKIALVCREILMVLSCCYCCFCCGACVDQDGD